MLQKFRDWRPQATARALVDQANKIIGDYEAEGYTLTLRQLYYQFVALDAIENSEKSYKRLGDYMKRAREAGMLSWYAIEDRTRRLAGGSYESVDIQGMFERIPNMISVDRWVNQPVHIEVWVEKEALGNVIQRACNPYELEYMSCKGYVSTSEMWRAGRRYFDAKRAGKKLVLIHLGDHDPSGIHMTHDVKSRLDLFSQFPRDMQVERIALNMDQVEEHNPPPNPAKQTDTRYKNYERDFGNQSWELDALRPQIITDLITEAVDPYIDWEQWNADQQRETDLVNEARQVSTRWDDIIEYLKNSA